MRQERIADMDTHDEQLEAARVPRAPWRTLRHPLAGCLTGRPDVLSGFRDLSHDLPHFALLCDLR